MSLSRRNLLKFGLAGAGTLVLPRFSFAKAGNNSEPHFFLTILLNQGADNSYMFDARPLAMTAAGKIQNYTGTEPQLWMGSNGGKCFASTLVRPLEKFKERFSIINGVIMTPAFDGHAQNMNYLFTGNSFGGDYFMPHLNLAETGREPLALDGIQSGNPYVTFTNAAFTVPLEPASTAKLSEQLANLKPASPGDELIDFVRGRYAANGAGPGRFSAGARLMGSGLDKAPALHEKLKLLRPVDQKLDDKIQFVGLLSDCFRNSIARSALWVFPERFDTHAADEAKRQPQLFQDVIARIGAIFQYLSDTPFDNKRSMLDVTTVMVTSEFGRTMRAGNTPVDNTGTNHNQFNNSVLIGGKGIRGGMVVGASDSQTADEKLSGAHRALDKNLDRAVGRPFDFQTMQPRLDLPEAFDNSQYLMIDSVINTVYSMFDVSKDRYRLLGRKPAPVAPVLSGLLT